jgi:hypothetical protein
MNILHIIPGASVAVYCTLSLIFYKLEKRRNPNYEPNYMASMLGGLTGGLVIMVVGFFI